ncbi:MAG: YraN family protein [Armatimonadota bacterium]
MKRGAVGKWGEQAVATWLERQGFRLLARNWRRREGEIDIVAMQGATLVFLEVKTRRSETFGAPEESVDERKQRQLARLAQRYLDENPSLAFEECRFDVVVVDLTGTRVRFRHYPNAFLPPEGD